MKTDQTSNLFPDFFTLPTDLAAAAAGDDGTDVTIDPYDLYNRTGVRCFWVESNLTLCYDNGTGSGTGGNTSSELVPPQNYWTLFLLVFPLLTVFGNVLVVLSVYRERSLRTVTNYFIVSLAIADIMVAILVMPISVYVEVNNSVWLLGDAFCDTWVAFDVMCCTASILNLTAISIDRFIAVTQPIKYAKHKSSNRVYGMLCLTWVVSLAISSPIALGMNYTERRAQTPTLCIFYNSDFIIYSSMGSFYIPCIVMILLYWRIFSAIRQRARKTKKYRGGGGGVAKSSRVIENTSVTMTQHHQHHHQPCQSILTGTGGRGTTSEGEGTEDTQTELLPTRSVRVAFIPATSPVIAEETSFINHNARLSPTTDDTEFEMTTKPPTTRPTTTTARVVSTSRPDENASTDSTAVEGTAPVGGVPLTRYNACGYTAPVDVRVSRGQMTDCSPTSADGEERPVPSSLSPVQTVQRTKVVYGRETRKVEDSSNDRRNPTMAVATTTGQKQFVTRFNFRLKKKRVKVKERNANRRERKATKTLAIVLGVFLFCWVPFFTINIVNAICIRYDLFEQNLVCQIDPILFSFFVWLGYINSFLNPVIYTIFNIEFRRAFKKLLTTKCC